MNDNDRPPHWTVTIQVHEVTPPKPIRDGNGYAVKVASGMGKQDVVMTERQVSEKFSTTVRADSEPEAYRKAMALLQVNAPGSPRPGSEPL
jgi:hypothetical protein